MNSAENLAMVAALFALATLLAALFAAVVVDLYVRIWRWWRQG